MKMRAPRNLDKTNMAAITTTTTPKEEVNNIVQRNQLKKYGLYDYHISWNMRHTFSQDNG